MIIKSLKNLHQPWSLARCKGQAAAPVIQPPPAYEPPPVYEPPPAYESPTDLTAEAKAEELEKKKTKMAMRVPGRTILTGLLTDKPETSKPQLKEKFGA